MTKPTKGADLGQPADQVLPFPQATAAPTAEAAQALEAFPGGEVLEGGAQEMPPAPTDAPGVRQGPKRPGHKGGRKLTKAELADRVRALEAELERRTPEAEASLEERIAGLVPALAATFATLSTILELSLGPTVAVSEEEQQVLAGAWAPCLAPHLESMGRAAPWWAAVALTGQIALPKYLAYRAIRAAEARSGPLARVSADDQQ